MRIESSNLHLASQHQQIERHERRETLRTWNDVPARTDQAVPDLSAQAQQMQPNRIEADTTVPLDAIDDLKLSLIKLLVEHLTGRALHLFRPQDLEPTVAGQADGGPTAPAGEDSTPAGFGLAYDSYESHYEAEQTAFSVKGLVRTADGKEIAIDLELRMSREFFSEQQLSLRAGDAMKDPLVINYSGNSAQLTQRSFSFDIDADGRSEQIGFLTPGSGFLALDRNADGVVNDGSELFGARSGDGFAELAAHDEDGNGWIDAGDAIYDRLRIWSRDGQGNDQLVGLGARGVGAIYLGHLATPFALRAADNASLGQVRESGVFLREDGSAGTVQQLDLRV